MIGDNNASRSSSESFRRKIDGRVVQRDGSCRAQPNGGCQDAGRVYKERQAALDAAPQVEIANKKLPMILSSFIYQNGSK